MRKRISILTLHGNFNFGNRLQNYATQEVIKNIFPNSIVKTILNVEKKSFVRVVKDLIKKIIKKNDFNSRMKIKKFKKFNHYIEFEKVRIKTQNTYNKNNCKKLNEKYDIFFVGSDQVWNYNFNDVSDIYFLPFVSENKRNSFSASFGIDTIDDEKKDSYKNYLSKFDNISVREDSGKKIVEELTGRKDVEVLIDPTMMLNSDDWDRVIQKPANLKCNKYILNCFLGDLSEERRKEIDRVAVENNCEVINIMDKESEFYAIGPSEFLYLEKNAFLICTDSFHSSVFAIIYDKPFIAFDREENGMPNMNSRFETLLSKFKLENRYYNGNITKDLLCTNYAETYKILEMERKKSEKFLKKILDIEK